MKTGDYIKLQKIDSRAIPNVESATWEEYNKNVDKSPPVGYTVQGYCTRTIEKGYPIIVLRDEPSAITKTTLVTDIHENLLFTENSIYMITVLKDRN